MGIIPQSFRGTTCQTAPACTFKKEGACRRGGGALFRLNMQQLHHRGSTQMFSPRVKSLGRGAVVALNSLGHLAASDD